jgi:hypothetical protein
MKEHRRQARTAAALVAGLALAIGLAGCASGDRRSSAEPLRADSKAEGGAANQGGVANQGGAAQQPGAGAANAGQAPNGGDPAKAPGKIDSADRAIVYTGGITIRVSNVDEAATRAAGLAAAAGGFVGGDKRTSKDSESEAQLVLRVPASRFAEVVDALGRLGTEESRAISTEDVTEQVVDVDSRIAIAQASVDRVRTLLARAQTISEIVALESELSRREADLESLKGRKRKLDDLAALSTITATLLGPHAQADRAKPETGFIAGLRSGWHAFLASLDVLLTVLGALLPWLLALGLPGFAVLWLGRRLGTRRAEPAIGAVPPATALPAATAPSSPPRRPADVAAQAPPTAAPPAPAAPAAEPAEPAGPAAG